MRWVVLSWKPDPIRKTSVPCCSGLPNYNQWRLKSSGLLQLVQKLSSPAVCFAQLVLESLCSLSKWKLQCMLYSKCVFWIWMTLSQSHQCNQLQVLRTPVWADWRGALVNLPSVGLMVTGGIWKVTHCRIHFTACLPLTIQKTWWIVDKVSCTPPCKVFWWAFLITKVGPLDGL